MKVMNTHATETPNARTLERTAAQVAAPFPWKTKTDANYSARAIASSFDRARRLIARTLQFAGNFSQKTRDSI